MRHYNYDENNEDFRNEVDKFWEPDDDEEDEEDEEEDEEEDDEEEVEEIMGYTKKDLIRAMELDLAENELDISLLHIAIQSLEKSFWWKFRSFESRLNLIAKTYLIFSKLILAKKGNRSKEKE